MVNTGDAVRPAQGQKMSGSMYISLAHTQNVSDCSVDIKNVADSNLWVLRRGNQFAPSVRAVIGTTHMYPSHSSARPDLVVTRFMDRFMFRVLYSPPPFPAEFRGFHGFHRIPRNVRGQILKFLGYALWVTCPAKFQFFVHGHSTRIPYGFRDGSNLWCNSNGISPWNP